MPGGPGPAPPPLPPRPRPSRASAPWGGLVSQFSILHLALVMFEYIIIGSTQRMRPKYNHESY